MTQRKNLFKKINNFINTKINKGLKNHGGNVQLIKLTKNMIILIKFNGGCNGCTMANFTLKNFIENTILKKFITIKGVIDVTNHKKNKNSFY